MAGGGGGRDEAFSGAPNCWYGGQSLCLCSVELQDSSLGYVSSPHDPAGFSLSKGNRLPFLADSLFVTNPTIVAQWQCNFVRQTKAYLRVATYVCVCVCVCVWHKWVCVCVAQVETCVEWQLNWGGSDKPLDWEASCVACGLTRLALAEEEAF